MLEFEKRLDKKKENSKSKLEKQSFIYILYFNDYFEFFRNFINVLLKEK